MSRFAFHALGALAAAALVTSVHASCGAAFCSVNTNWSLQGVWTQAGPHADVRFEFIDQDQPMSGTRRVAVGEVPAHHDEVKTINRNVLTTVDHGFDEHWGVTAVIPVVDRSHEHIHNHHGARLVETWHFTALGDVRVQGRYQAYFGQATAERAGFAGVTFGLVLPSGATDITNGEGAVAERSLQPGTGTTQVALSAYYRESLPVHDSSWYVQGAVQAPLRESDGYEPGTVYALDVGYRYDVSDRLGLNLQMNYTYKSRDRGAAAEPDDSGGQTLSVAPGLTYAFTPGVQAYGFVGLPLYRNVNGVQLTANWTAAAGVSVQF